VLIERNNYNIGVNKCFPLSPTFFGIHIDKLEDCLEESNYVDLTLTDVVFILLL
jgi:hypothetical protein